MMVYQAFFILCLIGVVLTTIFFECRFRALLFASVILLASYMFELRGIAYGEWNYENIDSLLLINDIPIEILFGYFTAGFFIVVMVENIPDISTRERRESVLTVIFLIVGIVLYFQDKRLRRGEPVVSRTVLPLEN